MFSCFFVSLSYWSDRVAFRLSQGLRYEDLYDPLASTEIKVALDRLPAEVVDARTQRLKRAMDLSLKHTYLPEDLQVFYILLTLFHEFSYQNRINVNLQCTPREEKDMRKLGS